MHIELKRICVATDFSAPANRAFQYGLVFARQFGAELHLLHVIEDVIPTVPEPGLAMLPTQEIMNSLRKASEEGMNKLAAGQDVQGVALRQAVREGVPFREICDYAKREAIDLVVVGTHGRAGLTHLLLGSVAERVVRSAPCPVLTIHSDEHEFIKED
jgi:nucleotide-binding universal stress UspA family protein